MALPVTIPNQFANATASIPLSQLDTNFTTLANAVNGISDGSETLANASVTVLTAGTVDINGGTIDGTAIGGSTAAAGSFTTLNTSGQVVFNDAGANVDFRVEGDTNANLLFVDASADSIGIGTNTPGSFISYANNLVVGSGSGGEGITIYSGTSDFAALVFADGTTGDSQLRPGQLIYDHGANAMIFNANGTERMRITSAGDVGIGTSSPARALHVYRSNNNLLGLFQNDGGEALVRLQSSNTSQGILEFGDPEDGNIGRVVYNHAGNFLALWTNDTERMRIDSSGNLLVGTTSSYGGMINFLTSSSRITAIVTRPATNITYNAADFQNSSGTGVGGIGVTSSSTSYATSSDYRLKHDIQPMTGALAKVALLKPVTYKWNIDDSSAEGFIAHELQEVCPSAVTGEKDAVDAEGKPVYQGIDTSFLVATLTAAIQEQQAIINAQQAALESLKARLDAANL